MSSNIHDLTRKTDDVVIVGNENPQHANLPVPA